MQCNKPSIWQVLRMLFKQYTVYLTGNKGATPRASMLASKSLISSSHIVARATHVTCFTLVGGCVGWQGINTI